MVIKEGIHNCCGKSGLLTFNVLSHGVVFRCCIFSRLKLRQPLSDELTHIGSMSSVGGAVGYDTVVGLDDLYG